MKHLVVKSLALIAPHSLSGTTARVFAGEHPDEVKGIVFVDALTPELAAVPECLLSRRC